MFLVLGFAPCYAVGYVLKKLDRLRIPLAIELAGMDHRIEEAELEQSREILDLELEMARQEKTP